jgi:nucleotide-binding universal stress UspA family protein
MPNVYGDGYVSGDLIEHDREEIEKEIKEAEAEFRRALHRRVGTIEWRSTVTFASLCDYVAHEARSADLVITGVDRKAALFDSSRHVSIGALLLEVGRPVLIVPVTVDKVELERVVVAWKDTRETRRAVFDALPLLKKAAHVAVFEIAPEEDLEAARARLEDVVGWLKRHGIVAESFASQGDGDDATRLSAIAQEKGADLIVAGAYGHNRLREWVLGGVTRDLLLRADRCSLVSH